MSIWKISFQNIKSKPLYTFLSIFVLSLSIVLLLGIQQLKSSFKHQMNTNLGEIDLVIGAKGSPLQLVLASVLHLDNPTGNISYKEAKKISKNPMIKSAVPISYGDNYKGFRIIGTNEKFSPLYNAKLQKGHVIKNSMEVVIGSTVAEKLNLKIGDTFLSSHGLIENEIEVHATPFKVVGIFKPTQKVIDRLIITSLESIWDTHNHEEEIYHGHHHEGEEHQDHHHENHANHNKEKKDHHHENHVNHNEAKKDHHHENHANHNEEKKNHHHGSHANHNEEKKDHHHGSHANHNEEKKDHHHENHANHNEKKKDHHNENHLNHNGEKKDHHHENHLNHNEEKKDHHHESHANHNEEKEITSLLITFKNLAAFLTFPRKINKQTNMQAALPKYELDKLYEYTGAGFKTISWIAYLILLISGMILFISLYKMVKERAFDFALLRTYGASNFQLIKMMIYEELTIVFLAFMLGFLLVKIGFFFIFNILKVNYTQIILQDLSFTEILQTGILVLIMVILSSSLAIYPIIKMNISTILSNEK